MTAQLSQKSEAWSARFSEPVSDLVKRYTASVFFDKRLAPFDIRGSLAHARNAGAPEHHQPPRIYADIERGMAQIEAEIDAGQFEWLLDLEDVHLNIEKRLTELVGDAGKRLHTGRSRNDQVATDIRLYLRAAIDDIDGLLRDLRLALLDLAEQHARHHPARLHPPAGGAAGHLRPPPAGLCRNVRPRCASAWPTAAAASTACRSAPPRWPAPPSRSTANAWPARSASRTSATTRSTPCPTATSPSNSAPPPRW